MKKAITLFLAALLPLTAYSARKSPLPDLDDGSISFYLDNDLFGGTDQDYTNGWRLAWVSAQHDNLNDFSPIQRALERLSGADGAINLLEPLWGFKTTDLEYRYGFAVTQLMYTPTSLDAPPPAGERPYAGWFGLGFSLHVADEKAENSVEFTVGTVGPHAYAEPTQDFVHSVRGLAKFNGWDNQIPNEVTANLHFTQKRRIRFLEKAHIPLLPMALDGMVEMGSSLGSLRTDAYVGFMLRGGIHLPIDFSDPRLSVTAHTSQWNNGTKVPEWSAYWIAGARFSYVYHDITLDGPVFRDFATGVEKKDWVGELYLGFGARYHAWEIGYIHTYRSEEYDSQDGGQQFGSLSIRWHF